MNLFADTWAYLTDASNWTGDGGLLDLLVEQLLLTFTALAIALVIALPVALWLGHLGRGGFLAINISGVGRAIPTFAVLALLVLWEPIGYDEFGPFGRAGLATLIALALFALPPIVTNTYVGVDEVPRDIREAADGMGMRGRQKFARVELPAGAAPDRRRHPAGPRAGLGHRHHRRPGGRSGPRQRDHRGLLQRRLPPRSRRCGGRCRRRVAA